MIIRYKGFYVDGSDTIKVSLSVDVPNVSHLSTDFKILDAVQFYLPRWINPLDCCIDIIICDNYRNKFHDYRYHNGHYAKFVVDGYYWLDYSNKVTVFKDLGQFPKVLIKDPDDVDVDATIAIAKKLWHITD